MYVIVLLLMLATMGISTGWYKHVNVLIDPPSLLVVILIPLVLTVISGLGRDLLRAFKIIQSKENIYSLSELNRSKIAVDAFQAYVWMAGGFGTILGMVTLFSIIDDMDLFLPSVSVSLLTLLYSLIIVILVMPLKYKIKGVVASIDGDQDEA